MLRKELSFQSCLSRHADRHRHFRHRSPPSWPSNPLTRYARFSSTFRAPSTRMRRVCGHDQHDTLHVDGRSDLRRLVTDARTAAQSASNPSA